MFRLRLSLPILATLLLVGACDCGGDDSGVEPGAERTPEPEPFVDEHPTPAARLIFFTDLSGYLEPCGCSDDQLGGIDRAAQRIAQLQADAPSALLAAGNFVVQPGHGHGPTGTHQDEVRAQTLVSILGTLGAKGAGLGPVDLASDSLAAMLRNAEFPILGAPESLFAPAVRPDDSDPETDVPAQEAESPAAAFARFEIGSRTFGIIAAIAPDTEPAAAALEQLGPVDVRVVLFSGNRQSARQFARAHSEVDFVILGGVDELEPLVPSRVGQTWILNGGRQGQRLLVLDLFHLDDVDEEGPREWQNASAWSANLERDEVYSSIREIEDHLEEWAQGDFDPAQVASQRARRDSLVEELGTIRPVEVSASRAFAARIEDVLPDSERDPEVQRTLARYDIEINDYNREAFADRLPPAPEEGQPSYVGSQRCQRCHQEAYQWWESHPHGHAYETLQERHKEYHLDCVGCHVTGYERPGGSTVTQNQDFALVDVGCEVCHGPGEHHAESAAPGLIQRQVNERLCTACHNEEHSTHFVYDAYLQTLLVPGHGRPSANE